MVSACGGGVFVLGGDEGWVRREGGRVCGLVMEAVRWGIEWWAVG